MKPEDFDDETLINYVQTERGYIVSSKNDSVEVLLDAVDRIVDMVMDKIVKEGE